MGRGKLSVWPDALPVMTQESTGDGLRERGLKKVGGGIGIRVLNALGFLGKFINMQYEIATTGYQDFTGAADGGAGAYGYSGVDRWESWFLVYLETNVTVSAALAWTRERNGAIGCVGDVYARLYYTSVGGAWTAVGAWTKLSTTSVITSLDLTSDPATIPATAAAPALVAVRVSGGAGGNTATPKFDLKYVPTSVEPD